MDKAFNKAIELNKCMGEYLAMRFINAKITHWKEPEHECVRTETLEFWEDTKTCLIYLPILTNEISIFK